MLIVYLIDTRGVAYMEEQEPKRGFLIMPFDPSLRWLHEVVVRASVAKHVTTRRADDVFEPGSILRQILDDIDNADIVFAVCTGKNANVFFELGYAWLSHNPILIAEDTSDVPFDIAAFRVALYGRNTPGADRETLPFRLEKAIDGVLSKGRLAKGKILASPPQAKAVTRLTARLERSGRGGGKLIVTNSGTVDVHSVNVESPPEAESFGIHREELPIDVLRPGESVRLPALLVMGGGPSIFDLTLSGETEQGEKVVHKTKISI
jgi:hypothetical protein